MPPVPGRIRARRSFAGRGFAALGSTRRVREVGCAGWVVGGLLARRRSIYIYIYFYIYLHIHMYIYIYIYMLSPPPP